MISVVAARYAAALADVVTAGRARVEHGAGGSGGNYGAIASGR